jgi:hypothetical protein
LGEVLSEPRLLLESFQFEQPRRNAMQALLASGLAVAGLTSVVGSGSAKVKKLSH